MFVRIVDAPLAVPSQDRTIAPPVGTPFSGTVATFTDGDPYGSPQNFAPTISWGDGTQTVGQVVYDGTASLTWAPDWGGFLAIGNQATGPDAGTPALMLLGDSNPLVATPLMNLTPQFHGGLAEDNQFQLYAISSNDAGESFLNLINVGANTAKPVAYLGLGFTGGLAYDSDNGDFYAIAQQGGSATLYSIDGKTLAVHAVGNLGAGLSGVWPTTALESNSSPSPVMPTARPRSTASRSARH